MPEPQASVPLSLDDAVEQLAILVHRRYNLRAVRVKVYTQDKQKSFSWIVEEIRASSAAQEVKQGDVPPRSPSQVPAPPAPADSASSSAESEDLDPSEDSGRMKGLHRCIREILATLRAAKRPLTKNELMNEMSRLGYEWSHTTVCKFLRILMGSGIIENPKDGHDLGYRIAGAYTTSDNS